MLIETEPCISCDFSPEYCSCDIDICQITRGESKPISSKLYEGEKLEKYRKMETSKWEERTIRRNEDGSSSKFKGRRSEKYNSY